ncbi:MULTISPECIES: TonB-dependent receptor [Sphingomonas]|jgi:iron complex outermembrane receptor protein|uniref:TonB-dependent receptor n=1 Tax=Sphingomonas hankookensis TaxID=563996 RepID=A0ABR5YET9_9SPHN|nr:MULTISPECIES: TonB-dependent receptor [Sphingomonas]KZE17813.1 TonB-dependent receptor [Sphingomonas hankookensis]PZT95944.1 MAG: TonB-dependent receptor [Sphingomonas sp.]WCP72755.1 TonB-dependent receptor [Sphingomonas hankookensis]
MKTRLPLLVSAAFVALATPAFAQTADAPTDATSATPGEDAGLGDIVVTAERREERLQNTPLSVGVASGDDLRQFQSGGEDTLLSLSGRIPGLYAETTTGRIFPRFYIRGLGNIDFYLGASQPVTVIQDDVILEHVVLKSNPVYDVAQVEVLRGPQGSLFGRNTTAGIIKFDTIRPTATFQSRAQASYGTYNSASFDAGVGGPIADGLMVRVSALVQHRDDWVDNSYTGFSADNTQTPKKNAMGGFDDRNLRLQLRAQPTDAITLDLSGHARWYEGTSTIFHRAALKRGSNDVSAEPRDRVALDEGGNNPQAYNTYGASARAAFDFGPVELTSITAYETTSGYSRGDTDGGAAALFPVNGVPNGFGQSRGNIRDLDQWSQELRLASTGSGPFGFQLGGFYFDNRDVTEFYQRGFFLTTAARNPNNWVRLRDTNTSWAAFGQAHYDFTDRLTLTAGARITEDTKRTRLVKTANTAANVVTYRGRTDVKLSSTEPSWDVSLLYKASDELSLYSRVARGFRGPTIQGRSAVFNADFTTADSETILSFETGFKSNLLDNTLRLNATVFGYRVKDIQLNGNDSNGNGVLFNADKAQAYGVEAELDWKPVPQLTLGLGGSWLHSAIRDKRVFAQVCALNGQVVCTVYNPTIRVGANTFAQIDGEPLPNAPEYTLDLTARWDQPLNDGSRVFIATDWNLQGYTQFTLYRAPEFTANGNFEGGLKIGYAPPSDAWELSVFTRNITNEKNLKGVIENYMAAVFNDPRIIGVSLSGRFR